MTQEIRALAVGLVAGMVLPLAGLGRAAGELLDSYEDVRDIDQMAADVRKAAIGSSFSRGWFDWERMRTQYVDEGRRDRNALKMMQAYFRGAILDRYRAFEKSGEGDRFYLFNTHVGGRSKYGGGSHGGWGSHGRMRIYEELVKQKMLTPDEQKLFKKIVIQSLSPKFLDFDQLERGANNRPYGNTGGIAAAVGIFPDMPRAKALKAWVERQWRELTEPGDILEVNHYPYGGLHLKAMLDIAEETGKLEKPADRAMILAIGKRYLGFIHGGGLRGNPNSGANVRTDREAIYRNPWHVNNYQMEAAALETDFWYRMAKQFKDGEFLWAAVQIALGGLPPDGKAPKEWQDAYNRRFEYFNKTGLKPRCPAGKSAIRYLSPLKHKIPERLYVRPGRRSGKPFVSYYIYDRNTEYMHCFGDAAGRLYEYCVDGAKLLGSAGKYNGIFCGQAYYDMLLVLNAGDDFPVRPNGRMGSKAGMWNTASGSMPFITNHRTAPDSANWRYDEGKSWPWRRTDDAVGGSAANMDGHWYLNNDYHLKTATLVFYGDPDAKATPETVYVRNLRLGGPKGDVTLARFDRMPKDIRVTRSAYAGDKVQVPVQGDALTKAVAIGDGSLRLTVRPGFGYKVTVGGFDVKFNVNDDYTRIAFDYKAMSNDPYFRRDRGWRYHRSRSPMLVADLVLNGRTTVHVHQTRGGILEWDSLRAENKGDDSMGRFTYRNYFGAHSRWTRQTVLTREGYLVVRDAYRGGKDVDGFQAGPIWCLRADGKLQALPVKRSQDRCWFDAPAWDHAWWQKRPKRLLVYVHPGKGLSFGQAQHQTTPDISRAIKTNSSFAKAIVRAGRPVVFLSGLVPHEADERAEDVVKRIRTRVDAQGNAEAKIAGVSVAVKADGGWEVKR